MGKTLEESIKNIESELRHLKAQAGISDEMTPEEDKSSTYGMDDNDGDEPKEVDKKMIGRGRKRRASPFFKKKSASDDDGDE